MSRILFNEQADTNVSLRDNLLDLTGNNMAMAKRPIDPPVARTRAMLQKAHISLILEKGYEAITSRTSARPQCRSINVLRPYTSKDDLRRSGLENLRRLLVDRQKDALAIRGRPETEAWLQPWLCSSMPADHIELYRALVGGRGGVIALGTIRQILSDLVRNELPRLLTRSRRRYPARICRPVRRLRFHGRDDLVA